MAHDVTLLGATYPDVPSIVVPSGNGTASFTDVTDTTATAADVASGKQFYTAAGVLTQGTSSGGGGSSAWTKVAEKSYTVSTTSTGTTVVGSLSCDSAIYTADKIVYVRIRDTAGKRAGCFYGTDNYFINYNAANSSTATLTSAARFCYSYTSSGNYSVYVASSGYGIYCNSISSNNDVGLYARYHSSRSLTINGTYKVEVYLLDPAGGVPIFG